MEVPQQVHESTTNESSPKGEIPSWWVLLGRLALVELALLVGTGAFILGVWALTPAPYWKAMLHVHDKTQK
jgi:hypothetical protein